MTTAELTSRVMWAGACTVAVISGGAWWLGGVPAAAGVAGGGGIALINFRWLARDVGRAVALVVEGRAGVARVGRIGLRQFVTLGALGLLVAHGWVHPAAVGLGLAALPPVLLVQGLLHSRPEEPPAAPRDA
jgi:ATP synthase I subunit